MAEYLLDTSAWIAHLLGEPGATEIAALLEEPRSSLSICSISILELFGRLSAAARSDSFAEVWERYRALFAIVRDVTEAVALEAVQIRRAVPDRLPTVDALIAATAAHYGSILIHRDPHFRAIPLELVEQRMLPES